MNNNEVQYMVHSFRLESIVFRGSEKECLEYINKYDSQEFPLELYWASKGEKYFIDDVERLEELLKEYSNNECDNEMW